MAVAGNVAVHLPGLRRREFRRLLALSTLAHGALFLLLTAAPGVRVVTPPAYIAVDLVAVPLGVAPAPAAPRRPPPKPPVPEKVVLPEEPKLPAPKPEAKPAPKPAPKPEKEAPPPEPAEPVERDYTEVLAQLRAGAGERTPEPATAGVVPPGPVGRSVAVVSPEVVAWVRKAKIHVRHFWVVLPGFRTQPLETHVLVELDGQGRVLGEPRIVERSGNPWYDDGVVRAIQKASPLPAPPEAGEWPFVFLPEDSY